MIYGRTERKEKQKWGNKKLDKGKEFKYLCFILDRKRDNKNYIKKLNNKENMVARKI